MKAYCINCGSIQPSKFRPGQDAITNESYEDLCCDTCRFIVATIQDREASQQPSQALSLDLLERLNKTLTRLGYATPEGGMEHFNADLTNQLYNLCRAVDSLFDREQPPAPGEAAAQGQDLLEIMCARIKAADDAMADGNYMLDSDDCISVIRGTWKPPMLNDKPAAPTPQAAAQPPAPSDTAITYMTGYSDGREWAQPSQAVELSADDVRAAGGIVHSDGNIFFTNIGKLNAAINAKGR